jgi:hypothetical protein
MAKPGAGPLELLSESQLLLAAEKRDGAHLAEIEAKGIVDRLPGLLEGSIRICIIDIGSRRACRGSRQLGKFAPLAGNDYQPLPAC